MHLVRLYREDDLTHSEGTMNPVDRALLDRLAFEGRTTRTQPLNLKVVFTLPYLWIRLEHLGGRREPGEDELLLVDVEVVVSLHGIHAVPELLDHRGRDEFVILADTIAETRLRECRSQADDAGHVNLLDCGTGRSRSLGS
jgi:hypothetical protein